MPAISRKHTPMMLLLLSTIAMAISIRAAAAAASSSSVGERKLLIPPRFHDSSVANCWLYVLGPEGRGCADDFIVSLSSPRPQLSPMCCKTISDINERCTHEIHSSNAFPGYVGEFFPKFLEDFCRRHMTPPNGN